MYRLSILIQRKRGSLIAFMARKLRISFSVIV